MAVAQGRQCDLQFVHREVISRHQRGLARVEPDVTVAIPPRLPPLADFCWWGKGGRGLPGVGEGFGRFSAFEGVVQAFHVQLVEKFVVLKALRFGPKLYGDEEFRRSGGRDLQDVVVFVGSGRRLGSVIALRRWECR